MSNGVDFRKMAVELRGQLTGAQSELAALREELAEEKRRYARDVDSADEETSALREIIRDLKDWRECSQSLAAFASLLDRAESVVPAPGPLRKALAAAEQRNAELEAEVAGRDKLLEELGCPFDPVSDLFTMPENPVRKSMVASVREAWVRAKKLGKPTESGASEC